MKRITIFIIILLVGLQCAIAQRMKYKDIAPGLDTLSKSEQIAMLRLYLLNDPDHPNATYRLSLLHYDIFKNSDPLLEYNKALAHAKEASLRLTKAKILVTNSEVKGDNEYYAPLFKTVDSKGKPYVEYTLVNQRMVNAYDSVQLFIQKMPPVYSSFTKSVRFYDRAVKIFASLNTKYPTLEEIYMNFGPELDKELEELRIAYDSSSYNFRLYKFLTESYPLQKYNQQADVKRIDVYRLDGLTTKLNFLSSQVELWNYSEWVDNVRKVYKNEIVSIKERIVEHEQKLNESLKRLETSEGTEESLYKPNKELIFQLNNYDKNSLALALLEYKSFKQNWLQKMHQVSRDTTMDSKLRLYSRLIQLNRSADTLVTHLKAVATQAALKKHELYIQKFYGGSSGLDRFIKDESSFIQKSFAQYQDVLKTALSAYERYAEIPGKTVKIGTFNIPLYTEDRSVNELDNTSVLTQRILKNPDGSLYVGGVHKLNKKTNNNLTVFVAKLSPEGKSIWFKELNFAPDSLANLDADNYLGDIVSTQEGCAVVVTSFRAESGAMSNTFNFINDKGELKSYNVKDNGMARKLIYQEVSNSFVMVFKGSEEKQSYHYEETIALTAINILGDLLWHQDVPLTGTLQEVVTVRDGYILTGNYTAIKDMNGRELRTKINQGQSNPYMIKLNLQGQKISTIPIASDKSIFVDKVIKVNDGSINLLGYETTFTDVENATVSRDEVKHMMIAYDLKQICSNF